MTDKELLQEFIDYEKEMIDSNLYEINRGYKVTFFQQWNKDCQLKIKAFETLLKQLK
jgi:lipopolysaccharide assembly outer membrane protein LptD (OstA)